MTDIQTTEQVTEEVVEQPIETAPEETVNPTEEAVTEEVSEEPAPEQAPVEPATPTTPEGFVPKEKFVASAKESILNVERANVANARLEELTKTDTPTDEAMRLIHPEWDQLDDYNKRILIKQEAQEMRQRRIETQNQSILDRQKLEDELEVVIESEPKLLGKESEFKRFAKNPKNRGISAEVLVKAFLFDVEPEPAPKPVGEALPQGNGGPREPLKPKKISLDEARKIRESDYPRYQELVMNDMIDNNID